MKVTHVITNYGSGGAGVAALRLNKGLREMGVDSSILCLNSSVSPEDNIFLFDSPKRPIYKKILSRFGLLQSQYQQNQRLIKGKTRNYEILTFPNTDYNILSHPAIKNADIINLHWVANFMDYNSFFQKARAPIVWTLHDLSAFLGIFHYPNDVDENKDEFGELDTAVRNVKKLLYQNSPIEFVAPSKWLANEAFTSGMLSENHLHHIPNGIDFDEFKIVDRDLALKYFNLSSTKRYFLFVAENVENKRKGFDLLVKAIKKMQPCDEVEFIAVGALHKTLLASTEKKINSVGQISSQTELAMLYSIADALILPSREDNLPNVMLESLACGTPVICFKVGGMLETINHKYNGIFANDLTSDSLATAIENFIETGVEDSSITIRAKAQHLFALSQQALAYINLYKSIIG